MRPSASGALLKSTSPLSLVIEYMSVLYWNMALLTFCLGCCPLLRPIIRCICPGLFPSNMPSSGRITGSKSAWHLTTILSTKGKTEEEETSSTHNVTDAERDDFAHAYLPIGVSTTITSNEHDLTGFNTTDELGIGAIHVQRRTVVEAYSV